MELAGAAAAILDVSLADLFDVNAIPDLPEEVSLLDEADEERLSELLDLQQSRQLSDDEATSLAPCEWGRRAREQGLQKTAALRASRSSRHAASKPTSKKPDNGGWRFSRIQLAVAR